MKKEVLTNFFVIFICFLPITSIADTEENIKKQIEQSENSIKESHEIHFVRQQRSGNNWPSSHPSSAIYARLTKFNEFFDLYIWRDTNGVWIEVSPGAFICSSSFSIIQDNIEYDTVKLETISGDSQCDDVIVTSIYKLTQWSFHSSIADLSSAFTLVFDGDEIQTIEFSSKKVVKYCFTDYKPVCGVDNQTYPNSCEATAAGVDIAHQGECFAITPIGANIGTVSSNLDIHIPSLNYQTLLGTNNISLDFEFYGEGSNNELLWKLKNYGENE